MSSVGLDPTSSSNANWYGGRSSSGRGGRGGGEGGGGGGRGEWSDSCEGGEGKGLVKVLHKRKIMQLESQIEEGEG